MSEAPMVAVEIPLVGDERRKHWAKVVHSVDTAKSSGWAFVGDFIAAGGIQDVPAGSVLVVYGEKGSRANPQIEARVYTANPDATLTPHMAARGRAWARTLRDTVEELLATDQAVVADWAAPLAAYPDQTLADELTRRGWTVEPPDTSRKDERP